MKARSLRTLTGMVLMLVIVTVSSCQVSSKVATRSGARARKAGEVLPLIISRISPVADHFYSTTEKVAIQPSFDPGMINLEAVTNYKLWLKDPVGGTWSQVVDSETIPIQYEAAGEGVYGVRISVVLEGEREFLTPQGTEAPQLWFCVDKNKRISTQNNFASR